MNPDDNAQRWRAEMRRKAQEHWLRWWAAERDAGRWAPPHQLFVTLLEFSRARGGPVPDITGDPNKHSIPSDMRHILRSDRVGVTFRFHPDPPDPATLLPDLDKAMAPRFRVVRFNWRYVKGDTLYCHATLEPALGTSIPGVQQRPALSRRTCARRTPTPRR